VSENSAGAVETTGSSIEIRKACQTSPRARSRCPQKGAAMPHDAVSLGRDKCARSGRTAFRLRLDFLVGNGANWQCLEQGAIRPVGSKTSFARGAGSR
jgi:hypothetical protein